jgi:dipeptidyl aminopeptidase/acylaminoacyl peptidase
MQEVEQPERIVVSPLSGGAAFVVPKRGDDALSEAAGVWYGQLEGAPARIATVVPDAGPVFSPDGAHLALGVQGDDGSRIEILRTAEPEAEPVAVAFPGFIERLAWTDAGLLALAAEPGADSASLSSGRPLPGAHADPLVIDGTAGCRRVWRVDLERDRVTPLTPQGPTVWEFTPLPSGAIIGLCSDDPREDGWYHPYLATFSGESDAAPEVLYRSAWQLSSPTVDPSGEHVAFIEGWASDRGLLAGDVRVLPLSGPDAEPRDISIGIDVTWVSWQPDGQLWFAGWDHLGTAWGQCDPSDPSVTATVHRVAAGCVNSRWHPEVVPLADGTALTSYSTGTDAPEVARLYGDTVPEPWTTLNAGVPSRPFELQELRWTGAGGLEIEGLLALPVDAPAGRPMALVVDIHGGPSIAWHHSWNLSWAEVLSEAGFAVLMPNPRGGPGRGQPFAQLNHGDPAGAEFEDVISGIRHCVDQGLVDPRRVGSIGASYGGYMTAWAITRPDVFAAGVPIAAVTDLISCRGTANNGSFYDNLLRGTPQTAGPLYLERSPIRSIGPDTVPTLILHGEEDQCVPVGQARELFFELHRAGVPSELVIYPREGHQALEPAHISDRHLRAVAWFTEHLVA